jgi:hypothetical protein
MKDFAEGWITNWRPLNDGGGDRTSDAETIEDFGEVVATFDILWKRGGCVDGVPDGQWNEESITIKKFDPFALANSDELDSARWEGRPLQDIYRAYLVYGEFRGTYSKHHSMFYLLDTL